MWYAQKDLSDISSIFWCAVVGNASDVTCCSHLYISQKIDQSEDMLLELLEVRELSFADHVGPQEVGERRLPGDHPWNAGSRCQWSLTTPLFRPALVNTLSPSNLCERNWTCSLQTPRLPPLDPAYLLTCSNPCVGLAFFTLQNLKP